MHVCSSGMPGLGRNQGKRWDSLRPPGFFFQAVFQISNDSPESLMRRGGDVVVVEITGKSGMRWFVWNLGV